MDTTLLWGALGVEIGATLGTIAKIFFAYDFTRAGNRKDLVRVIATILSIQIVCHPNPTDAMHFVGLSVGYLCGIWVSPWVTRWLKE